MRAGLVPRVNWQTGLLLDDSTGAVLFNLDVCTPIPNKFQRAVVAFANGDSSLDVFLGVHVPDTGYGSRMDLAQEGVACRDGIRVWARNYRRRRLDQVHDGLCLAK